MIRGALILGFVGATPGKLSQNYETNDVI